jgi:predicted nucleic acid-binding protein
MTPLLFDTNILSTFGKIKQLDLLEKLFRDNDFLIPTSISNELFKAKDCGYKFVDYIMDTQIFKITPLEQEEVYFLEKLRNERQVPGPGELECILICRYHSSIFITNDAAAKKVCDHYDIQFIDLSMLLKSLIATDTLTIKEVRALIDEIENKDKVIIADSDDILSSNDL